jgi:hypothetical protein
VQRAFAHALSGIAFRRCVMKSLVSFLLVTGFLILDWLRFHDILKPEIPTLADDLTGFLSILAFSLVLYPSLSGTRRRRVFEVGLALRSLLVLKTSSPPSA